MAEEQRIVKRLAEKLEKKLGKDNILNVKYVDQNFHMQKESMRHERKLDRADGGVIKKGL